MKKKRIFWAVLMNSLVLGLAFIGCDNGTTNTESGGGTGWNGVYESNYDKSTDITTVDLTAKTITGGYKTDTYPVYEYDGALIITDVILGTVNVLPNVPGGISHSGKWAYVFSESKKIGLIFTWTMTMAGYNDTEHTLIISGDKSKMQLGTPWIGKVELDFDDLEDIGIYINADKED